eukprot:434586-Prymnesium_polylepis.1
MSRATLVMPSIARGPHSRSGVAGAVAGTQGPLSQSSVSTATSGTPCVGVTTAGTTRNSSTAPRQQWIID